MKRSRLTRTKPLKRRKGVTAKRSAPRRREAPRWDWADWQSAAPLLAARSEGACERCADTWPPLERHHRQRRRDGGERLSNILILCTSCHRWCHDHPAEARKAGWIVSVTRDPAEIPVLWRRRVWVLFDDMGGKRAAYVHTGDAHT